MCAGTWGGALPPPEQPSGENLVENGGFEEGWSEPWLQVGAGSSSMPGWEVTEGGIDFGNYYANGHCKGGACAYEGASFVDMCGNSRGAIAQNVPTKAGYKYQLKFMYDVHATCTGKGTVMRMDVLLDGVNITRLELANGGTWNLQWNEYSHEFLAAGGSSRLELKSVDSACGCMVVDWVQVYEKEPPAQECGSCSNGWSTYPQSSTCAGSAANCAQCFGTWSAGPCNAPAPTPQWESWAEVEAETDAAQTTGATGTCSTAWGNLTDGYCATSKSACELCAGTWKPSGPTLLGCRQSPGWTRPGGDVAVSGAGAEACKTICRRHGYIYFGLECPMNTRVHCQCNNYIGGGVAVPSSYCQGNGGVAHVHCIGPYVKDGYYFGDSGIGSIYSVN